MIIRLNEIPQEGRDYDFDRESGELNEDLRDLIGDREYRVKLEIKPIGNAYEMRGSVMAMVPEICSNCGYDFDQKLERKINEIMFEEQEDHRKAQSVHGNQSIDFLANGPAMIPIKGDILNPGEYTHEVIALEEPFYPVCGPGGNCLHQDEVNEIKRKLEADFALAEEQRRGHPAFSVLKTIDVKKS